MKHVEAERVKGADAKVRRVNVLLEPLDHFARRFFGERKGKNALGFHTRVDEVQNLLGYDTGFARTGSGNNQLDAVFFYRFLLRRVDEHKKHSERGRRMLKSCPYHFFAVSWLKFRLVKSASNI